jgi:hypothetical protein
MPGIFDLNPNEPRDFSERFEATLEMRYVKKGDDYEFYYRAKKLKQTASAFLAAQFTNTEWVQFIPNIKADLNIGVDYGDHTVIVETVDDGGFNDLYWASPAIRTREDRTALYGELRYWDGSAWQPNPVDAKCRRIKFKAKLNTDRGDMVHKFSFYVILPSGPLEIDPDIRNPSV